MPIDQVITAFTIAAVTTTFASICAAILDMIIPGSPHAMFFPSMHRSMIKIFGKCDEEKYKSRRKLLNGLILSLTDQQLFTGYALLVSRYIRMSHHSLWSKDYMTLSGFARLREAHFHLVAYLSCLSSSSHLSCMIALKGYFQNHRKVWKGRFTLTTIFYLFLAYTLAFSWAFPFANNIRKHVHTHFLDDGYNETQYREDMVNKHTKPVPEADLVFTVIFAPLIIYYPFYICFYSITESENIKLQNTRRKIFAFFFKSMTVAFVVQIIYFIYSLVYVWAQKTRKDPTARHCDLNAPEEWRFGQTLPLLLLVQPLLSTWGLYQGISSAQMMFSCTLENLTSYVEIKDDESSVLSTILSHNPALLSNMHNTEAEATTIASPYTEDGVEMASRNR